MLSQTELEEIVRKTVILYNRYRSPEAVAKIVSVTPENVTLSFSGSFCYSCGVLDFLEDFVHEFRMLTDKAELKIGATRRLTREPSKQNTESSIDENDLISRR